jgi:hypothetical protein
MVKEMVGGVVAFLFGGLLAPGQAAFSPADVTKQLICDGPNPDNSRRLKKRKPPVLQTCC